MVEVQNQATEEKTPKGAYYKKSWKKWLLIYLVVGGLVYGIIYVVMAYGAKSSDSDTTNSTNSGLYQY